MKNYVTQSQPVQNLISITCDKCKKTYRVDGKSDECFESQEFLSINYVGGYESLFGDGNLVLGDFCQSCVKELLGSYLRIIEDDMF